MQTYIVQRLLAAIPTIFGITVLIFLAMRVLPGDPFLAVGGEMGATVRMTEDQIKQARAQLGLDRPYYQQYLSWMVGIPVGVLSATRGNSLLDYLARIFTVLFIADPGFWLAILIVTFRVLT